MQPLKQLLARSTSGASSPKVDIIALHGLNHRRTNDDDHAWNTWRTPAGHEGRLRLRDDLPQHVPESRIFLYEYISTAVYRKDRESADSSNEAHDDYDGASSTGEGFGNQLYGSQTDSIEESNTDGEDKGHEEDDARRGRRCKTRKTMKDDEDKENDNSDRGEKDSSEEDSIDVRRGVRLRTINLFCNTLAGTAEDISFSLHWIVDISLIKDEKSR